MLQNNYIPYGTNPRLDKLVDSNDYKDRINVAKQRYGLDKLINDKDRVVREVVAWQGYRLDILINDEDDRIREVVARQGYGLDKLINDKYYWVRDAAARHGYGLDILINDENWVVRKAVAEQGYGLDKLIYDENEEVRKAVKSYLKEHNLTLEEWCKQNKKSPFTVQNLKEFIYKVEDSSKIKIETSYDSIESFFEDTSDESYENKESIVLIAVDTKIPLIKLEKTRAENKNCFKFIVDISNKNDNFIIRSIFDNKEKFDQLLQSTINTLREYFQFSKYADELESCL